MGRGRGGPKSRRRAAADPYLNFHQLYIVYTVAQCNSFSRAAQELLISQPAVSIQVQELERSLGAVLFHRQPKGLQLTDVGRTVFDYAQRIFALADEMRQAIQDIQGLNRGRLTVGASTTPGEFLLPIAIGRFRQIYPGIEVEPVMGSTTAMLERILRRELDIAVVGQAGEAVPEEVRLEPYTTDELVLIARADHPLTRSACVTPQEVAQEGVIIRETGSATRRTVEQCFAALGVTPRIVMELGSNQAVKQAVIAGLGLGVISRFGIVAEVKAGLVAELPVQGWRCQRPIVVAYRRDKRLSAAQEAFLEMVRQEKPLPPPL